jgi:hypothetical protein
MEDSIWFPMQKGKEWAYEKYRKYHIKGKMWHRL